MKKITKLTIENFKFFQGKVEINFDKKNVLIYGENGSGKSTLYWALYTILQSSLKEDNEIQKYFDSTHEENLINIFLEEDKKALLKIEIIDEHDRNISYQISKNIINTNKKTDTSIIEAVSASDFINHRLLSSMYHFKNSQNIELFPIIEEEFLPHMLVGEENLWDTWKNLKNGLNPRPKMSDAKYKNFIKDLENFNIKLETFLSDIARKANDILKNNFYKTMEVSIEYLKGTYDDFIENSTTKRNHKVTHPSVKLFINFKDKNINKPHIFLNEAKLTAIALSLRFAMLKTRLSSSNVLKLLVLDDLLISLDMSHRFEIIKFILEDEDIVDYQKIILTHDKSFFNIMRHKSVFSEWKEFEFYNNNDKQSIEESKNDIEKAKELFGNKKLEECCLFLRVETERILKEFLDPELKYINKGFVNLENLIGQAKNEIESDHRAKFIKIFRKYRIDNDTLNKIDTDFENNDYLSQKDKGILKSLKKKVFAFTKEHSREKVDGLLLLNELKNIKDRVLNPQAHSSESPIFSQEVEEAIKIVDRLKKFLKNNKRKSIIMDKKNKINKNSVAKITSKALVFDFNKDIIEPLKNILNTLDMDIFLETTVLENYELLTGKNLEIFFDELKMNDKMKLISQNSEAILTRLFTKGDWATEDKKEWGKFVMYRFSRNAIKEPLLVNKMIEKNILTTHFDQKGNEQLIFFEESIPF